MRYFFLLVALGVASAIIAQTNKNISGNVYFLENKGQVTNSNGTTHTNVLFTTQKQGVKMALTKTGICYQWQNHTGLPAANPKTDIIELKESLKNAQTETYRMDVELVGANPNPVIEKHNPLPDYINYYPSHRPEGILHVQHYQKVVYKNIYEGIDWVWYFNNEGIKYDFVVHPGADYRQIRLKITGATHINILPDGSLTLTSPMGQVHEAAPSSFANNEPVTSRFVNTNGEISFAVGQYAAKNTLVIDPSLAWSTYYGDFEEDFVYDVAVDKKGNTYIVGTTYSTSGISDSAGYQKVKSAQNDGFIVKFDDDGNRVWASYYGGTYNDQLTSVCTDQSLNVITCGYTNVGANLSTTGSHQPNRGGYLDAILVKFDTDGTRQWATYYGGSEYDAGNAVVCDANDNIFMGGATGSSDSLRIAAHGYKDTFCGGQTAAFLAKFYPGGVRAWGTYYCGTGGNSEGNAVTVDSDGNAYLAGNTKAQTDIAYKGLNNTYGGGSWDGFLAKFNTGGARLWGTYYGGTKADYAYGVATDAATHVYITGYTTSTQNIAYNGYRNNLSDTDDVFVAKLDSSGARLWATYYGGNMSDRAYDITINKDTNIFIGGTTYSDTGIALSGYNNTYSFLSDAFFSMFNKNGALVWGSYYGGNDNDNCVAIAAPADGVLYVAGYSETVGLGSHGFQNARSGKVDGLLSKFFFNGLPFGPFISGDKRCSPGQVMLIARAPRGPFNVEWFADSLTNTPFYTSDTLYTTLTQSDTFWVTLNYKGSIYSPRYKVIAQVTNGPVARFNVSDSVGCLKNNSFFFKDSSLFYLNAKEYSWDFGNDSVVSGVNSVTYSYPATGIYDVMLTVTDSINCSSTLKRKIYVGEEPVAGYTINADTQCFSGNFYSFTDTSSIPGGGNLDYYWDLGNGQSATLKNPQFTYTNFGVFTPKLVVSSIYGCKDSATHTVTVLESPVADFVLNADTQCFATQSFVVNNTSYLPAFGTSTFEWDFGDSTTDNTKNPVHTYAKSGSYTIHLKVTDSLQICSSVFDKQVTIIQQPRVGYWMFNDTLCLLTNAFAFNDTSSIVGGKITKYMWDFGDSSAQDTTRFPVHKYKTAGSFDVKLVVVPDIGCTDSVIKTVVVLENPRASFQLSAPAICLGTKVIFTNTSTAATNDPLKTYTWDFGDANASNIASPEHTYLQKGTYSLNLRVSTNFGCDDDTSVFLPVYPNPEASYNVSPSVCEGVFTTFLSTATISSGSIAGNRWFFGNGDSLTSISPSVDYKYPSAGTFNFKLVAISNNGCTDSATGSILILSRPSTAITGPATVLQNIAVDYSGDANANWQYHWLVENGVIYANGTSQTAQMLFPFTGTAKVKLYVVETTTACKSDTAEKIVSVGANSIGQINNGLIKLYPNPVNNRLTIETQTEGSYTLTDITGRTVTQGVVTVGNTTINTEAMAPGAYVLTFADDNGNTGIYKLVKE